ncbi:hypothetical protein B9G55_21775 [Saccharibacillus sp. O16]|nr:hypothetical protein B9G55_21775 [Saccharibacillus sp. O16]
MQTLTSEKLAAWHKEWENRIEQLSACDSGRRGSGTYSSFTPDPEVFIAAIQQRLNLILPHDLQVLIRSGVIHHQSQWSLPSGILLPFDDVFEGDLGWNLIEADHPYLFDEEGEEIQQRRYLTFHQAGNGDLLLLDLEHPSGTAIVSWSHEEDEFRLLAPSLASFFDRITTLGLIGAHAGSYLPFLGSDGLEPDGENGRIWQSWLKDYAELNWEKVRGNLPATLRMIEMRASDESPRSEIGPLLLEQYTPDEILSEWIARNAVESSNSNRQARWLLIGEALGSAAADWVRSLWKAKDNPSGKPPSSALTPQLQTEESSSPAAADTSPSSPVPHAASGLPSGLNLVILIHLTASCLPEEEGLALVWRDLEAKNSGGRMQPPYALSAFHSRRIIPWMEPHVSFPIDGWVSLLADSRPAAEDLIRWLRGADALRMTAVQTIGRLPEGERAGLFAGPDGEPERAELLRLLEVLCAGAVLRKEKAAIQEAIAAITRA